MKNAVLWYCVVYICYQINGLHQNELVDEYRETVSLSPITVTNSEIALLQQISSERKNNSDGMVIFSSNIAGYRS